MRKNYNLKRDTMGGLRPSWCAFKQLRAATSGLIHAIPDSLLEVHMQFRSMGY